MRRAWQMLCGSRALGVFSALLRFECLLDTGLCAECWGDQVDKQDPSRSADSRLGVREEEAVPCMDVGQSLSGSRWSPTLLSPQELSATLRCCDKSPETLASVPQPLKPGRQKQDVQTRSVLQAAYCEKSC